MYKLLLSFTVISDVYRLIIQNKTKYTKYCLTQWFSKIPSCFEIYWVKQNLVNLIGLAGIKMELFKRRSQF